METTQTAQTPSPSATRKDPGDLSGYEIRGEAVPGADRVLTPAALAFVTKLVRAHRARRDELLALRIERQSRLDAGERPDFLTATAAVRQGDWKIAPVPADLQDRRVEITGPVDRKMVINALNSGASTYMADFEDSHAPTWAGTLAGQANLMDAVRRTISYVSPEGKSYALAEKPATLLVRPRGWHLDEKHLLVDGRPAPASLFDFGLYVFHNAAELLARGTGPYFYLPKMESHLEARLWNEVFVQAQDELGLARGTIKACVLIETILAAFEMDEILYELREHSAGINCGRWDYIFSVIKKFRRHREYLTPDRALVTMTAPFLRAYSLLAIRTAHRRGAHAIGGMAAQIPIKNDPAANEAALAKVRADKQREVSDGHDGTWVAHPGLVPLAREIFDYGMPTPNQIYRPREDVQVTAKDLLTMPPGPITAEGLALNLRVAVQYMDAWLSGQGCVPLNNLMEDAATAEISRSQVWQWRTHGAVLADGRVVTPNLIVQTLDAEVPAGRAPLARRLVEEIVLEDEFVEFLTLKAYDHLDDGRSK